MSAVYADSLLGQTWDLRVGHRGGEWVVEPPNWHKSRDLLVANVEGLCRKVLNGCNDRLPERLEDADYDESLGFLLGQVVVLVCKYRPRDERSNLGAWLKQELRWDLLDMWERVHGRHGEKRVVDQRGAGYTAASVDDRDPGLDRPREPAARGAGEPDAVRALPREWSDLPADRRETLAAEVGGLGVNTGRGGQGGADRASPGAVGGAGQAVAGTGRAAAWLDCVSCGWRMYPQAPNGTPGWHMPSACVGCGETIAA